MENKKCRNMKLIGSFLSLAVVAILVIIGVGFMLNRAYGWFAMNENVTGEGMAVKPYGDLFELSLPLNTQRLTAFADDSDLTDYITEEYGFEYLAEQSFETDNSHTSIYCKLSNDNPFSTEREVKPGDYGTICFDIVPKVEDDLDLNIDLWMRGVSAIPGNNGVTYEGVAEDSEAHKLLNGHIILFRNRTAVEGQTYYYYSNRITDTINYKTEEHQGAAEKFTVNGETHYRVTYYWVWPTTFAQLVFDETNEKLLLPPIFNDADERAGMIDYMLAHKDMFLKANIIHSEENPVSEEDQIAALYAKFTSIADANNDEKFIAINEAFNNADQMIGETVRYFMVEVDVNPNVEEADTSATETETETEAPAEP